MASNKVALVTGANKGIGFAIVRGLAKQFDGDVFLGSRNEERGAKAVEELQKEGLKRIQMMHIDINDVNTVKKARDLLKEKYGGIDVLVNNAGIAFKMAATESFAEQAKVTLATNYFATKDVCDILFPILKDGARVVNLSSSAGFLGNIKGSPAAEELKKKLASPDLTEPELSKLMQEFIDSANDGTHSQKGWPNSTYVVSKIGVSALSRIQQREFDKNPERDIVVNHVHPGYVDTDMTSHKGPKTIDEGARSSIYTALLPPKTEIRGKYIWEDCTERDWVNG